MRESISKIHYFCIQFYRYLQNYLQNCSENGFDSISLERLSNLRDQFVIDFRPSRPSSYGDYPSFNDVLSFLKQHRVVTVDEDGNATFFPENMLENFTETASCSNKKKRSRTRRKNNSATGDDDSASDDANPEPSASTDLYHCVVCNISLENKKEFLAHQKDLSHKAKSFKSLLTAEKSRINTNDKIHIRSDNLPFDEAHYLFAFETECDQRRKITLHVENHEDSPVEFKKCQVLQYCEYCTLQDVEGVSRSNNEVVIDPGQRYKIEATFKCGEPGEQKIPILFQFIVKGEMTHLMRYLQVTITNSLMKQLRPVTPYTQPTKSDYVKFSKRIIPGPKPPRSIYDQLEKELCLYHYNVPGDMRILVKHKLKPFLGISRNQKKKLEYIRYILKSPLTADTHQQRFSLLLHLEELQREKSIQKYDMSNVRLIGGSCSTNLFALTVPGLVEQRPSIIKGDRVILQLKGSKKESEVTYEGFVHEVRASEVRIAFGERFNATYKDNSCNVRFCINRLTLRFQHRAVELVDRYMLEKFLFPTGQLSDIPVPDLSDKLYDQLLRNNSQQLKAIEVIVSGCFGNNPYILHGPPGTGKTVTLVEAMKQVARCNPDAHILACAPSNSAADLISQKLLQHFSTDDVIRMYALSRPSFAIPDDLQKASNFDGDGKVVFGASKDTLMDYRFVITTLTTAGRIASAKFPRKHFTHVFIDEAGHASEPEALVAIGGIIDCGHMILAGDPKQLGPVIVSKVAVKYGLDISLMERLMNTNEIYQRQNGNDYDPRFITKLRCNYRSHPSILKVPNELFYENELEECADKRITYSLCRWSGLAKQDFPVMFHSVVSREEREAKSPSYFNTAEINIVMDYVQELLSSSDVQINPADIGIISPYSQQVKKLRQALRMSHPQNYPNVKLRGKDLTKVSVGSTEEFQGQERSVIIITTVRSDPDRLKADWKCNLGFLRNPKRFNVALTRAQALLIIVGNPYILSLDDKWNKIIEHCYENGSMKGIPFNPNEELQLVQQLESCGIGENDAAYVSETDDDSSDDEGWKVA